MTDTIPGEEGRPNWLSNKVYQVLGWVAFVVLPALAIFVNTAGPAMGLSYVDVIVTTLNALGLLITTCIGVSLRKAVGSK